MQEALKRDNPCDVPSVSDADLSFAANTIAVFGNDLPRFRELQVAQLWKVVSAIEPMTEALKAQMHKDVLKVAKAKKPALIAFWTAVRLWPDRSHAFAYAKGF